MFQKKDIIYSETIGVCVVDDIVKLADNKRTPINITCCGLLQSGRKGIHTCGKPYGTAQEADDIAGGSSSAKRTRL